MHRLPKPSPALIVSLVALFFALGGSAYAIGSKELSAQPRCATGAVRGIALVTGTKVDLSGLSTSSYTNASNLFGYRWSCTGNAILVRKDAKSQGVDVKFAGNPATVAVVSSAADGIPGRRIGHPSVGRLVPRRHGRLSSGAPEPWQAEWNVPFVIVLL